MSQKKICVILPTLNEEQGIKEVLEEIPNPVVNKVVVVDGHSVDNTIESAKSVECGDFDLEIMTQEGTGKGMAFQTFLKKFDLDSHDIYVMLDADKTYDPAEIKRMIRPLLNGTDVVLGERFTFNNLKSTMPYTNYLGNKFFTALARLLYAKNPKDVCTGYWAFNKEFLKAAKIQAKEFDLEVNLFSQAAKGDFKIKTIPIKYGHRVGKKKLKIWHGFNILLRLMKERVSA